MWVRCCGWVYLGCGECAWLRADATARVCVVWRVAEYGGVESDRCMGVEPDGMFVHLFCV